MSDVCHSFSFQTLLWETLAANPNSLKIEKFDHKPTVDAILSSSKDETVFVHNTVRQNCTDSAGALQIGAYIIYNFHSTWKDGTWLARDKRYPLEFPCQGRTGKYMGDFQSGKCTTHGYNLIPPDELETLKEKLTNLETA
jgi:hypothetical protein